jgi:hypothetical protein
MLSSFQLLVEVRHHALPLIGDPAQAVAGDGQVVGLASGIWVGTKLDQLWKKGCVFCDQYYPHVWSSCGGICRHIQTLVVDQHRASNHREGVE